MSQTRSSSREEPPQHGIKLYSLCSARVHPLLPITSSSGKLHLKHHDGSKTGSRPRRTLDTLHWRFPKHGRDAVQELFLAYEAQMRYVSCGMLLFVLSLRFLVFATGMLVDDHLECNVEDL